MTIISAGWSKDRPLFKIDARVSIVALERGDLDLDDRPSPPLPSPRENSVNHRNQLISMVKGVCAENSIDPSAANIASWFTSRAASIIPDATGYNFDRFVP